MAFSLLPKEDEYFHYFTEMAGKIEEAALLLAEMLSTPNADLSGFKQRIKDVEHGCDTVMHAITTKRQRKKQKVEP